MRLFDITNYCFRDVIDPIPDNCYLVETQDDINQISASITGGGEVWVEDGTLKWTGKAPSQSHIWNGAEWVISEEKQAELLNAQRNEAWERIKAYRYQRSLGGVYIDSVGKWFQTGEEEKTKYLGLSHVIKEIGSISWKTYENDFVEMTPTLLNEIFAEMVRAENADHVNSEKHKALMMQSDTPLEYDFSGGWERRYED